MGGGEEKLDDLFTYKKGDEVIYFVSKGYGDQELDVGPSGGAATILVKGEVTIQGYEYEDVEILEFHEEQQPITELPVAEPTTREAFTETTAVESMVPPEIGSGDTPSSKVDFLPSRYI